jgi:hypothetical protein
MRHTFVGALAVAVFAGSVCTLMHTADGGCMSKSAERSCPAGCAHSCPPIWVDSQSGFNVPSEDMIEEPCKVYLNAIPSACGTPLPGREPVGCSAGGTQQCCWRLSGDPGVPDTTIGPTRGVPKDGAYQPCGGPPGG